ncbi:MAG: hypothetical protein ABI904_03090 [Chloroflexota bacterium]
MKASTELRLEGSYSVIVLIGGAIDVKEADVTRCAIETIAGIAERKHLVIICGGTDMGVMAEIGQVRQQNHYKFPLIGIAPEELVSFPGGPRSTKFLWWGKQRWRLEPHYSHFILVPGSKFGDESPWIVDTATLLSKGHKAVTILINGGEVSRKDIELSLEINRHVIVLSRTGRLADELTREPDRDKLITVVPANSEQRIVEAIQEELSTSEGNVLSKLLVNAM